MTITGFFSKLGAPLANPRWSWGGVRGDDGAVFLRVWQDRTTLIDGKRYVMITHHKAHKGEEDNLGYNERNRQVELVKSGAKCFLVMCQPADSKSIPRKIKSFNSKEVFVGGDTAEKDGDYWIELIGRTSIDNIRK